MIFTLFISEIRSQVVCSLSELVVQLQEDIADNGKLDCLRESIPNDNETEDEKVKRLAANWTGDCSFESFNEKFPWKKRLEDNYALNKGLIDVNGNPIDNNAPEQADLCEIIRTLIGNNPDMALGSDVNSISKNIVNYIDCPGNGLSAVCAATAGSFGYKKGWYIFLDGQSIRFKGKPVFEPNEK